MIAGHVEERGIELVDLDVDLVPLGSKLVRVLGIPFDIVANAHHELGLHEVDAFEHRTEYALSMTTRAVGHDRELEVRWVIAELQMSPRRGRFGRRQVVGRD